MVCTLITSTFFDDSDKIGHVSLARNVLILTLILDDEHGVLNLKLWSIYYHLYLDDASLELLSTQASKLCDLAKSLESWHNGKYGHMLRFCNSSTMKRVRNVWNTYCFPKFDCPEHKSWAQHAASAIQRAMDSRNARVGSSANVLSEMRSAAPASIRAITDAPKLERHFWDHGTTDEEPASVSNTGHINPMFVTDASTLHYGTDPLLGFHLVTAYSSLKKESPLQTKASREKQLPFKVVEAARVQFEAWVKAFRQTSVKKTVIRFFAGDAIHFSYALQLTNATKLKSTNIYHEPYHWDPIVLDDFTYAKVGNQPVQFNVIDTSNLIDHLGSLNLLVAVAPLLCNSSSASLYTECLVHQESSQQNYIDNLLCGHFPTISTLMGLFPVEYWSNSSPHSSIDDMLLDSNYGASDLRDRGRKHIKLTWKQSIAGLASDTTNTRAMLQLNEVELARILYKMYLDMFPHENMQLLSSDFSPGFLSKQSMPRYHRGSFALVLRFLRNRIATNWNVMMSNLLDLIETESTVMMSLNYIQELYLYLHLYSVHTVATLSLPIQPDISRKGRLANWKEIPSILCVTLIVPREKVKVITEVDTREIGTPIMQCLIQSSMSYKSKRWQNIFSVIQISFGNLSTTGTRYTDSFQVNIEEDQLRWRGTSPLLVSFLVPTWTLLLEPQDAKIAFGIQSTPDATRTFISALGVEMNIFETTLGDEKSVFFTRFAPNQKDDSSLMLHPSSRISGPSTEKSGVNNTISANIDLATLKLTTLTCRLYMLSSDLQRALQSGGAVQTSQKSPCTFFETVGPNSIPIVFHFPAPVIRMKSRTRIARKSLYIEVEAPLADVTTWKDFPAYLYPVLLTRNIPILWNMSRLNLECLPIIDTSKKVEIQWLNTHIGGMFNTRERQLKAQATAATAKGDVRFAFRDSLLTLFMLFTGLQGHKSHITTLNNPTGGGVHVIILVSSLKLDLSNRTVFLDCAMLPLTHKLMPQLGLFLRDFSGLEVCHIEVDTDEIQLWRQNLPAMVERCRSWSHQVCCEYRAQGRIPLSIENGHQVICSCGNGKFPTDFIDGIPHWKSVSRYFVRAAISLCFSAAFSEQLVDLNIFREKLCPMPP